ncbi:hypothetical protein BPUTEOMOX_1038 [methanotrophic endosymbiont of Bathymodiolus puteoserpentis (Logatchev)]|nr:hypothetical protein BPUTEOMOX_1038 [methanotrophic endosymbiont of Bathymodiolus puteoserpentis (Logatchev)]
MKKDLLRLELSFVLLRSAHSISFETLGYEALPAPKGLVVLWDIIKF